MNALFETLITLALIGGIVVGMWGLSMSEYQPTLISQSWYALVNFLAWFVIAPVIGLLLLKTFNDPSASSNILYEACVLFFSIAATGSAMWTITLAYERSHATPAGSVICESKFLRANRYNHYTEVNLRCETSVGIRDAKLRIDIAANPQLTRGEIEQVNGVPVQMQLPIAQGALGSVFIDGKSLKSRVP